MNDLLSDEDLDGVAGGLFVKTGTTDTSVGMAVSVCMTPGVLAAAPGPIPYPGATATDPASKQKSAGISIASDGEFIASGTGVLSGKNRDVNW